MFCTPVCVPGAAVWVAAPGEADHGVDAVCPGDGPHLLLPLLRHRPGHAPGHPPGSPLRGESSGSVGFRHRPMACSVRTYVCVSEDTQPALNATGKMVLWHCHSRSDKESSQGQGHTRRPKKKIAGVDHFGGHTYRYYCNFQWHYYICTIIYCLFR